MSRTTAWRHRPYRQQELPEFLPGVAGAGLLVLEAGSLADESMQDLKPQGPCDADLDPMQLDGADVEGISEQMVNIGDADENNNGGLLPAVVLEPSQGDHIGVQDVAQDDSHVCRLLFSSYTLFYDPNVLQSICGIVNEGAASAEDGQEYTQGQAVTAPPSKSIHHFTDGI